MNKSCLFLFEHNNDPVYILNAIFFLCEFNLTNDNVIVY